jgi:NAD(P)-dependent dehydrogenase (short-subunit alcohol dehydrogenase family)
VQSNQPDKWLIYIGSKHKKLGDIEISGLLKGKVALVTGGSSGMGRETALVFAREGAKVVVADIAVAGGEQTVKMIEKSGGSAFFVKTDVTNEAQVEALVAKAVKTYGRLDCAFNNAGLVSNEWDSVININLKGVWLCMNHEIPQMIKQCNGAIVNNSSFTGLVGMAGPEPLYIASKHGVIGLTKAAAIEYAKANIRVNGMCPGYIQTPLRERILAESPPDAEDDRIRIPMGRIGMPLEVAEAVAWLCSDAASYVTGLAMAVDGGVVAQ